jgi:signal transduction histidine kinase
VRRSLRPLERVRSDIRRFEQGEVEELATNVPEEILPLVQEVNRLLRLLTLRVERTRNSLGNLAHALKTPINLLVQTLDHAETTINAGTRRALTNQTARLHQLVERELRRARLAGAGKPVRRFVPATELPELVGVVRRMHQEKTLEIEISGFPDHPLPIDREDMLELLGNLLDNACKWAKRRVHLDIAGGDIVRVRVADDGPGVPDADLDRLTQRGVRMDEERDGYGLGLAIAHDIVKLYSGKLEFRRSPELGGLEVVTELVVGIR